MGTMISMIFFTDNELSASANGVFIIITRDYELSLC
jgi:hypothetical protein